ncbi:MAG: efflux RND transporter permease subunit [Deltaproteobacteria bacterium]|nr:efflux RND transporter permease subunit [Deltaproteobacteria bacterium]
MNITEICIRKPILAWMLMAATVVFGILTLTRIGISQFPDVDFPTINVSVGWEGASPESLEHDVVEIIEEALTQVEGIRSIASSSRQSTASITIELDLSRDVATALQDVQTKVGQAQNRLPRDIDPPVVTKTNPEDNPIMWVGLSGPYSRQMLSDFMRYRLKEKLQTVPGVGEVTLGGFLERNIRVWIDAARLDERGLTVEDVLTALRREHVELPAGRIETSGREVNVTVLGEALDLKTLEGIPVKVINGSPIRLADVALIEDGFEDVRRLARVNGVPAQGLGIRKQRGANAVAVAHGIKAAIAEIRKDLPPGMELGLNFDSTQFIEDSVQEVELELILAVFLTALVCWLFLGSLSSTLNVVFAIPMSLLGTVAIIYFLGFTLNTFTLLALSLSVGIVVDDAIMVLENIYRHAEGGADRVTAARLGTKEITFAALAATLAVVAIFIPVIFMEGIVGKFFLQFGITLSLAVLLSYVEAVTLAPARASQMLSAHRERSTFIGRGVDAAFEGLARLYGRSLVRSLRAPGWVLTAALLLSVGAGWLFQQMPTEMVPSQDQSRLMLRLQTAVGADLAETDKILTRAEQFIHARPEVARAFVVVGGFGGASVNGGMMFLTLVPPSERSMSANDFAGVLRKELNGYPGLRAMVQDPSQQGFSAQRGFPIEFSVRGANWDELVEGANEMMQKLRATGAVVDLDSDYRIGMPELRITPDRARAADLGVSVDEVATTVNALIGGVRVGKYSTGGRRVDMRVRLLAEQRSRPEDLARLRVRSASGALIPLSSLVTQREFPALQSITRRDRERAITIYANVAPGRSQDQAIREIERLSAELPPTVRAVLGGASVAFRESMGSLYFAIAMGILVAYMILASQFNSLLHPVTVLTILPLSVAGAVLALWLTGATLNVFSMIGLLLLMGIVKKNSIILVDYANQARERGLDPREAMEVAGPVRLRPILMTSTATMMAAVPSAIGLGAGAEIREPMALSVLGGVIVSTLLSLFVVPAFYVVTGRLKKSRSRAMT